MRRGEIYQIRFLDHSEGGEDPIEFLVWGRVRSMTRAVVTLSSWDYPEQADLDDNVQTYTIVRRAILEATRLYPLD